MGLDRLGAYSRKVRFCPWCYTNLKPANKKEFQKHLDRCWSKKYANPTYEHFRLPADNGVRKAAG